MRILHITPSYKPAFVYGGPTISVSRLCETLAGSGHSVEVATTRANGPEELAVPVGKPLEVDGVRVRYFRRWTGDHSHFSPGLLAFVWRQARAYDVVHVHSWWNLPAMLSVALCRWRGIRPVVSPRGMLSAYTLRSKPKRWFHRWLGKRWLRGSILHVTSAREQADVRAALGGCAVFQAPNIVELPEAMPAASSPPGPWRLIFMGRIHPKKGLELLFGALGAVQTPFELLIVGDGETAYIDRLKQTAQQLGIAPSLRWMGWVDGPARFELLASADLFVLSSQNENFANAALEALAVGVPVLLSDQVGLAEYAVKKGLGWSVPYEAEAFLAVLQQILQEPRPDAARRANIAAQVRADFEAAALGNLYTEAYEKFMIPKSLDRE